MTSFNKWCFHLCTEATTTNHKLFLIFSKCSEQDILCRKYFANKFLSQTSNAINVIYLYVLQCLYLTQFLTKNEDDLIKKLRQPKPKNKDDLPTNPNLMFCHSPTNPNSIFCHSPTNPNLMFCHSPTNPNSIFCHRQTNLNLIFCHRPTNPNLIFCYSPTNINTIFCHSPR